MAETDPKTQGKPCEGDIGAPVWGTMGRVLAILVAGTALFYYLGRLTSKVRGLEAQFERSAEERSVGAPATKPISPIPDLPRMARYPNAISFSGGEVFLLNGIPRRIATFGTHDRPNQVSDYYVAAWEAIGLSAFGKGDAATASASAMDGRSNLRYSVTAQWVEESQTTVAHLSVSTLSQVDGGFQQTHLPLPEGSVPIMDVQSKDAGAPGTTVAYLLPMSTGPARAHLIEKLRGAGWTYEENYSQKPDERGFCVLFFSHGNRLLTLALDPVAEGKSSMIVNESVDLE